MSVGSIIILVYVEKADMEHDEDRSPAQFVGCKVVFKNDEEHAGCWHVQVGLAAGVVLRAAQSLAQKAELLGTEGINLPDWLTEMEEVPRLWVKVDPCSSFPRGCEAAVEQDCLVVVDSPQGRAAGQQ
jgi:hypothetical protein